MKEEIVVYQVWENFIEDENYKSLFLSNKEIWFEKLERLKDYIESYQKLPQRTSKDEDIKRLGTWCSTQKQNFIEDENYKSFF